MDYRVFLCDDSAKDTEYLLGFVESWAKQRAYALEIRRFSSGEALLFSLEDEMPDILLLDIEMPGINGVELARRVREKSEDAQIVFVTGYSDYIAEGYDVSALHYLMKPVDSAKLTTVLDRAVTRLLDRSRMLTLHTAEGTVRVPFREIVYIESRRNYVTVHAKEDYTEKKTLAAVEQELDDRFFRAGRSFILNLSHVRQVLKNEVLFSDGTKIPLPRGVYEALNRTIIEKC